MVGDAVVFTNNVFFICICCNKKNFFLRVLCKSWVLFVTKWQPSESCDRNWQNESEKQDTITFCTKPPKKGKRFHIWKWHVTMTKKGKRFHIWKCHVTLTQTKAVTFFPQSHCSTFILKNQLASFSYQHSISFTHGLQYYRNLGQTGLHRLCGL